MKNQIFFVNFVVFVFFSRIYASVIFLRCLSSITARNPAIKMLTISFRKWKNGKLFSVRWVYEIYVFFYIWKLCLQLKTLFLSVIFFVFLSRRNISTWYFEVGSYVNPILFTQIESEKINLFLTTNKLGPKLDSWKMQITVFF